MLHHVSLEIPPDAIERSSAFWAALGFAPVPAPAEIADYVSWFEREGTQIHLIQSPEPTVSTLGHPAVVIADFDGAVAALRAEGFEVDEARALWGARRAFAGAPGGHRVELMAAAP